MTRASFALSFARLLHCGADAVRNRLFSAWLVVLFLTLPAIPGNTAAPADTLYRNGIVYTVDANNSVQQALAVGAGRILYVGSNDDAAAWTGPATTIVDLRGRVLLPGLVDAHVHPLPGGAALLSLVKRYDQGATTVGRLGADPGLSRQAVLRAATVDAAYAVHIDNETGSLESGKLADLIVLDRNPLAIEAAAIAGIKVLQTVVGGSVVYQAADFDH